ncbi:MAG: anthranilate synthase component I, partial [Rhizobiales bacterium]|nr:anthranilate synthase component I [Hyphomicrobiales bacterium]
MQIEPVFDAFEAEYGKGRAQVVWSRLIADLETPVSAMLKLSASTKNAFLLESVEGGAVRGRYSIIGLDPDLIWRAQGPHAEINRDPAGGGNFVPCAKPTLDALRELLAESAIELPDELAPMAAGVFGYMGYDTVRLIEHLPDVPPDRLGLPDALFIRPSVMVIFDAVRDEITVVAPVRPQSGRNAETSYNRAIERITSVIERLEAPLAHPASDLDDAEFNEPRSNTTPEEFHAMVGRAKSYIEAGDVFQVVLSQRFEVDFPLPPFSLYRALRRVNPSPFLFFLDFEDFAVIGSS